MGKVDDFGEALALDGNAVAGELIAVFGIDLTASPVVCAHCGNATEVGGTRAFVGGPGIVLRCPTCAQVMLRMTRTPRGAYLDAHGVSVMLLPRRGE